MTTNRESLLDKIRALMSKTTDNGCTEAEALAALSKARAMMDAYEVSEEDLRLSKEEKAILRKEPPGSSDPHGIKASLAVAISEFCNCKVWNGKDGLVFCGLRSDAQFASWLTDSLARFVQAELVKHLMVSLARKSERKPIINGFVGGCARRINERLRELCANSSAVASSNSRALVLVKGTAIADKMAELGIRLGRARRSKQSINRDSYAAGRSAGDGASFGRPVSGAGGTLRLA